MRDSRPEVRVVQGHGAERERGQRIALSLVHPRERIDIPVSAIVSIEATEGATFAEEGTGKLWTFRTPRVELCFTQAIVERICRLSRQIVDEPVEIIVGGECVSNPVVREPLTGPCTIWPKRMRWHSACARVGARPARAPSRRWRVAATRWRRPTCACR